jgi:hypothetical protein
MVGHTAVKAVAAQNAFKIIEIARRVHVVPKDATSATYDKVGKNI